MILGNQFCTPHSSPFQAVVHAALHQSKKKRLGTLALRGFRDVMVRLPVQLCTVSAYYPVVMRAVSREGMTALVLPDRQEWGKRKIGRPRKCTIPAIQNRNHKSQTGQYCFGMRELTRSRPVSMWS